MWQSLVPDVIGGLILRILVSRADEELTDGQYLAGFGEKSSGEGELARVLQFCARRSSH